MNALSIGQRATHTSGAHGVIVAEYNGGACYQFLADSGARFTVRADEVAAEGRKPAARHVECGTSARVVVAFERAYAEPKTAARPVGRPRKAAPVVNDVEAV